MKVEAGDESRDQMKCQESQESKEGLVRAQNKRGSNQAGEGSSAPALRLGEKERVKRKFGQLSLI